MEYEECIGGKVMDHVLNSIQPFYDVTLREFMEAEKIGNYKKLSENPIYGELKAIIDAMNCINKYMGWETIKLSEEVKEWEEE